MKQARVRSYKTIRRPLGLGWGTLRALVRVGLRILIALLPLWPFIVLAALFFLPVQSPHLRVSYTYTGSYEHPSYRTCRYLGIHGTVDVIGQDCPIVRLMGSGPF
jgi:hypothetical protein